MLEIISSRGERVGGCGERFCVVVTVRHDRGSTGGQQR